MTDPYLVGRGHVLCNESAPSHTRLRPVTITLQALSLVEKAEPPVQLHFTLRLRNQRSMWIHGGCKSLHGFLHGIEWIVLHGHLDYFQNSSCGGRPNIKPLGDHGTPNTHNCWFILFDHVRGPAWVGIHWSSSSLSARSHMTSHYTWGSVTTLHSFGGGWRRPWDTSFWALTISWSRLLAHVWSAPNC